MVKFIIEINYQEGRFTICANGQCVADKINVKTSFDNLTEATDLATQMYGELANPTKEEIEEYQKFLEEQNAGPADETLTDEEGSHQGGEGTNEEDTSTDDQPLVNEDENANPASDVEETVNESETPLDEGNEGGTTDDDE